MIRIVKGDLLKANENIIAHQVNAMGVMGSGVALQIKNTFPLAFTAYKELVDEYNVGEDLRKDLLGQIQGVYIGKEKYIFNLFGQHKYGTDGKQYTDTEALFNCFKRLRLTAERLGLSVALPYMIGSFRGGAKWEEVERLLDIAFDGYEATLYRL